MCTGGTSVHPSWSGFTVQLFTFPLSTPLSLTPFQTSLDELSRHLALCLYLLCLWLCLCQTVPKAGRTQLGLERGPHGKPICSTVLRCVEPGQFSCLVPQLHSGPPLYHHHSHLVHLGYR